MHPPIELTQETITDSRVKLAHSYWVGAKRGRHMPARSDIDPLDLRVCLGWICMIEVVDGAPKRFRYRLDGSKLVETTGFDLTGKYVDQIESEDYRQIANFVYSRVVQSRAPLFLGSTEDWLQSGFYMESVTLPLSEDGENVSVLMEVICPAKTLRPGETFKYLSKAHPRLPFPSPERIRHDET